MASAFGHAIAGYTAGKLTFTKKMSAFFWFMTILCAVLPDVDAVGYRFGVPYDSMWGHRGFTHSLLFAAIWASIVVALFFRKQAPSGKRLLLVYFFAVTASHGFLDALTNGGHGVGFFIPFTDRRYFFPWRPIQVSPLSVSAFMSARGWNILVNEATWIGFPCVVLMWARKLWPSG